MSSKTPCCRICLFRPDMDCTLFKHCGFAKMTYADMLCYITDIKVTVNDGLPDKICKSCCRDLEKAYSFTVLAKGSDKKLRQSGNVKKKLSFNSIMDIKKELRNLSATKEKRKLVFDSISDIKCKLDNLNVKKEKSWDIAAVNETPGNTNLIANTTIKRVKLENEPICKINLGDDDDGSNVSDDNLFKDDLSNDPDFYPSEEEMAPPKKKPKPANCNKEKPVELKLKIGNACIFSNSDLKIKKIQSKSAVTVQHRPKAIVNGNSKVLERRKAAALDSYASDSDSIPKAALEPEVYSKVSEPNEKPLKITDAARLMTKKINSTRETPEIREKMVCPCCGILTYLLDQHMITHLEKEFKCQLCNREYHKQSQLDDHMRHHTGEKTFICDECGQGYMNKKTLVRHTIAVHQNKPLTCTICSRKFTCSSTLRNHMDTHAGIKRHQCTVCGSAFRRQHHLKAHMVTHTGERIYSCEVCYSDFPYKVNLNNHVLRDHNINIKGRQILKFTRDLMRQELEKLELSINSEMQNNIVNVPVNP